MSADPISQFHQFADAIEHRRKRRRTQLAEQGVAPFQLDTISIIRSPVDHPKRDLPVQHPKLHHDKRHEYGPNYIKEEETLRNDYSQHFIDSNSRPQNFIRNTDIAARFDEYPKLKLLASLKDHQVDERATPAMYLKTDLRNFPLSSLGSRFDVILLDPPLEEYARRSAHVAAKGPTAWSFDDVASLPIPDVAANPSFIFIWMGNYDGLDLGRKLLTKWGYRRCEDIVWTKTNKSANSTYAEPTSVLQHTKEHCLMGIKGTVRRSVDSHFIHCNVDTDVIVCEGEPSTLRKPKELYHIIEHFCQGRRRLQLFGDDTNIRRGWVTVGTELTGSNWDPQQFGSYFTEPGSHLLGANAEIQELRPKSPPPRDGSKPSTGTSGGGIGMGYNKQRKQYPPRWQQQ